MLSDMLPALMPNARELLEPLKPWLFDEESAADLGLLHAIGVLGSMREAELTLFFRGTVVQDAGAQGHVAQFAVCYPAFDGRGQCTSDSALHATRRRLLKLVKQEMLAVASVPRTTPDHLDGRYFWLTGKGTRRVLDAGYRVRNRQNIDNMTHVGTVQDQHRVLEQQYIIARRLINPSMRFWGEYAIRSGLARQPLSKRTAAAPLTVREQLVSMSRELFLTPAELGKSGIRNTMDNRLHFKRRPDVLLLDEAAERLRRTDAVGIISGSDPPRVFGDVEWVEIESSKKDTITQARSFNGIFHLGEMLDPTLERGRVTKFTLVTRNHPHANLRAKLLDAYKCWLKASNVQAMLEKKAKLTRGFDLQQLSEQVSVAELIQDPEHRLIAFKMESMTSALAGDWRS